MKIHGKSNITKIILSNIINKIYKNIVNFYIIFEYIDKSHKNIQSYRS
jgi:hypothetical protein